MTTTAAPLSAEVEFTETRTVLRLTNAEPITSWPILSGNRFTPTLLVVHTGIRTDGHVTYVAAQTGEYARPMTERWWSTDAVANGPHDPRHMPPWIADLVRKVTAP